MMSDYQPDTVSPPGETIREQMRIRGLSLAHLAHQVHLSQHACRRLLDGALPITPQLALALEQALDTPATFWARRDYLYRQSLVARHTHR